MRLRLRFILLIAVSGCYPFPCGSAAPDVGQFGAYLGPYKLIRLPNGDTLTVYRVKAWTFADGSAPALQIEYQTRVAIADTLAVKTEQRRLWPVFRSYLDQTGFSNAIITATDREYHSSGLAHASRMRSFGTIVLRDATGRWHAKGDIVSLAASVPTANVVQEGAGIFERTGEAIVIGRE
jgi:hypothetical protein